MKILLKGKWNYLIRQEKRKGCEKMGWRIFDQENRFMAFMYKMNDLFLLNVLWIVTSIPIITIGASTTALYTVVMKIRRNEESYIVRSYFKAFRENFRQGTILWLLVLAAGGILYLDLYITAIAEIQGQDILSILFLIMAVLFVLVTVWIFPVLARYAAPIPRLLRIAVYLSLRHVGYTLLILAIICIPMILIALYLYLLPVFLIISVSGSAYLSAYFIGKIYERYVPEKQKSGEDPVKIF